jgi:hypothetical protein
MHIASTCHALVDFSCALLPGLLQFDYLGETTEGNLHLVQRLKRDGMVQVRAAAAAGGCSSSSGSSCNTQWPHQQQMSAHTTKVLAGEQMYLSCLAAHSVACYWAASRASNLPQCVT